MKILIQSATHLEVQTLKDKLKLVHVYNDQLVSYVYQNVAIDMLVSGIGMVAKAYMLGRQLQNEAYDLALNIGIGGSYKEEIPPGSVVNVVRDRFSEMGAEDGYNFITIADLNFDEFDTHPFSKGIIINNTDFTHFGLDDLKKVNGITSNTIHGCRNSISSIITKFNPDIETMGGAAFLYSCLREKMPCAQIRSVSNFVEVRNRSKWNIALAIDQLTQKVLKVIDNLTDLN